MKIQWKSWIFTIFWWLLLKIYPSEQTSFSKTFFRFLGGRSACSLRLRLWFISIFDWCYVFIIVNWFLIVLTEANFKATRLNLYLLYRQVHGRRQDFFSGGGTLFQKFFKKLPKNFQKLFKKFSNNIQKIFKKFSKIFKNFLKKIAKNALF